MFLKAKLQKEIRRTKTSVAKPTGLVEERGPNAPYATSHRMDDPGKDLELMARERLRSSSDLHQAPISSRPDRVNASKDGPQSRVSLQM